MKERRALSKELLVVSLEKRPSQRSTPAKEAGFDFAPGLAEIVAARPELQQAANELAKDIHFSVSTRTISGIPLRCFQSNEHARRTEEFALDGTARYTATKSLQELGFQIHYQGWFDIRVSGSAELIARLLGKRITLHASTIEAANSDPTHSRRFDAPNPRELFFAPADSLISPCALVEDLDCFFLPPTSSFAASPVPSSAPPAPNYFHVDSGNIRKLLNVPDDATGEGVTVAIVDTGFERHPFYLTNKYDYQPIWAMPPASPSHDPDGHGTAIALNLFAVAPKVTMLGFAKGGAPHIAVQQAVSSGAEVISCSWGWSLATDAPVSTVLEATIFHAVNVYGKVVLFASGNGPLKAWPASMKDVIAIGGVYWDGVRFEASNYASGFASNAYPGRSVPDFCGLCGQQPAGIYIMLPCPPHSKIDTDCFAGGKPFPHGDGQPQGDGWAGASGTSCATPQVAGVVALLLQKAKAKNVTLSVTNIKTLLQNTSVPVTIGTNAHNIPATGHPNGAVGYGLVNAAAALAQI
jgi:serine protease AprX